LITLHKDVSKCNMVSKISCIWSPKTQKRKTLFGGLSKKAYQIFTAFKIEETLFPKSISA